jgi:hypothetical protein
MQNGMDNLVVAQASDLQRDGGVILRGCGTFFISGSWHGRVVDGTANWVEVASGKISSPEAHPAALAGAFRKSRRVRNFILGSPALILINSAERPRRRLKQAGEVRGTRTGQGGDPTGPGSLPTLPQVSIPPTCSPPNTR